MQQVVSEYGQSLPSWISIKEIQNQSKFEEINQIVDKGEASAIALALETQNSILIIDERKGRKLARELNLEIIGTLRVLLLAKQKGIIPSKSSKNFNITISGLQSQ